MTVGGLALFWLAGAAALVFLDEFPWSSSRQEPASEEDYPRLKENFPSLQLTARAALSVHVGGDGKATILYNKNEREVLPIASLAKLMTAVVIFENYSWGKVVVVSDEAVRESEDFGGFKIGESFTAGELVHSLLVESSNDAAAALSGVVGRRDFVRMMNEKARELGLADTRFTNPTGLDGGDENDGPPRSTAEDLIKFARFIREKYPQIFDLTSLAERDIYDARGMLHHRAENTNELLLSNDLPGKILGGKTGETAAAGQALLLLAEDPRSSGYIASVLLKSDDRFQDMKDLVNWDYNAYRW